MTVAKQLNFRRAAHDLGVSQPTLTTQINALETQLGLTLFERSRSGTLLSAHGHALLYHAEQVLKANLHFHEVAEFLVLTHAFFPLSGRIYLPAGTKLI